MNCRYVARLFAMIGARSSRYIIVAFFSRRISELASSLAADTRSANSQSSILPPNPHILTRHRSTAELRVVGIETSRTESLTEEPPPESNNLAMSRLYEPEQRLSVLAFWPSSFTQCVYSKKKETNCCAAVHSSTAVIAHGFWVHIRSIPWATSNRQTCQLGLRRGSSRTARNVFAPLPHGL